MRLSQDRLSFSASAEAKRVGDASSPPAPKRLLDYLPAIYEGRPDTGPRRSTGPTYLALYLRAFERLLFGGSFSDRPSAARELEEAIEAGLEEEIAALPTLIDPFETPEEFLPWLASWVAVGFHPEISLDRRRNVLAEIIPLYRIRGTRTYLEKLLTLCVNAAVSVSDAEMNVFEVGVHSTVGSDAFLGGGPPHFFSVKLIAPKLSQREREVQLAIARSVIELAKPAHTVYELALISPEMQIGRHCTLGLDTVLGPASEQT